MTCLCPVYERLPGSNFPYLDFVGSEVHFLLWPAVARIEKEQILLATGVFEEQSVEMISFVLLLSLAVAEHYCLELGGLL